MWSWGVRAGSRFIFKTAYEDVRVWSNTRKTKWFCCNDISSLIKSACCVTGQIRCSTHNQNLFTYLTEVPIWASALHDTVAECLLQKNLVLSFPPPFSSYRPVSPAHESPGGDSIGLMSAVVSVSSYTTTLHILGTKPKPWECVVMWVVITCLPLDST